MMRQPKPLTRHGHREAKPTSGNKTDGTLHRHHAPRRSSGSMLARKYRNPWPTESDFSRDSSSRNLPRADSESLISAFTAESAAPTTVGACSSATSSKIRRETYLTALDQFLVGKNLCCECHDNIVAEWEDHEQKRSGSRSLQDVFSVFPPFLDDEDEDDEGEDDEEDDEETGRLEDDLEDDMLAAEDIMLGDEELVFKYELERESRQNACGKGGVVSNEYLAALEVGKRQEDELLRLIQKEERYIIIREDHTEFIMDLIRCGEQFSYASTFRSGFDDDDSKDSDNEDDVDDTCPGANTSHLAQEYILEVLAIKFREQVYRRFAAELVTEEANHHVSTLLIDSWKTHIKKHCSTRLRSKPNCFETSLQTSRRVKNLPPPAGRRRTRRRRSAARKRLQHRGCQRRSILEM
uniref:Uncharacterized protein n=1 Tax=Hyaloperonospora arabidopsidis (strain Emoy2) TaxID=559515 RepID=M4BWJ3_HYAAE